MSVLIRWLLLTIVRVFYRTFGCDGAERVPEKGPVVVVANHPNGLLDPVVTGIAIRRRMGALGKSTLFGNPFGRAVMGAFDGIPVYRARDNADTSQNERTFQICRDRLAAGGWIMLFPEGTSHSDPALKPMKTGAARIALSAEAAAGFKLGLRILPVGLLYEDKEHFRSRVVAAVGNPMPLDSYAARYAQDERGTVNALTDAIEEALGTVVLQAESDELWRGFLAVAAWTDSHAQADVTAREARARTLAEGYRELSKRDPDAAESLVNAARRFSRVLESIGVENPYSIDLPTAPTLGGIAWSFGTVVFLAPFALIGLALWITPYQLVAGALSILKKRGLEPDLTATMKAIASSILYPVTYLAEAALASHFGGWAAGTGVLLLAPPTGFIALRWMERISLRREAIRSWWVTARQEAVVQEIGRLRVELAQLVENALGRHSAG